MFNLLTFIMITTNIINNICSIIKSIKAFYDERKKEHKNSSPPDEK